MLSFFYFLHRGICFHGYLTMISSIFLLKKEESDVRTLSNKPIALEHHTKLFGWWVVEWTHQINKVGKQLKLLNWPCQTSKDLAFVFNLNIWIRKVCSKCSKIFIERVRKLQTADKNVSTRDDLKTSQKGKKHQLAKLVLGKFFLKIKRYSAIKRFDIPYN